MNREHPETRLYRYTYQAYVRLYPEEIAANDPMEFDTGEKYEISSYRGEQVWNRSFGHLVKVEEVQTGEQGERS